MLVSDSSVRARSSQLIYSPHIPAADNCPKLEMIEAILDHLHDDKKSLQTCSLACKDWVHPTRRILTSRRTIDLYRAGIDWSFRISAALPFLRHICIRSRDGRQDWDANLPLLVEPNHSIYPVRSVS
jgi:hypothetical protein